MKCPNCNETEHEDSAHFCHKCGNALISDECKLPSMKSFTVNGISFNMILVEGGKFWKGAQSSNPSERNFDVEAGYYENPVHQVSLDDFYIGETPVTQGLWLSFGYDTFSKYFPKNTGDTKPVFNAIHQHQARQFCSIISAVTGELFRLPSDDEWEYAARGGNISKGFRFAGSDVINDVCWSSINSKEELHPVKLLKPNELGIYDMSGNVYEWCLDQSDVYGFEGGFSVRGGSYQDLPEFCRVSSINGAKNGDSMGHGGGGAPILYRPIGFRLVMIPKKCNRNL